MIVGLGGRQANKRRDWHQLTNCFRFAYTIVAPQSVHAGDLFVSVGPLDDDAGAAFGAVV